jgi:hypothetical protein
VIGLSFGQGDMATPILQTKLYVPPHRPRDRVVPRPRLIERLNAGLLGKLTLISAPAGFGKTTLLSEWVAGCEASARFAWLSLPLSFAPVGVFMLTGAIVFRIKRMRKETNDESSDWRH